MSVRVWKRTATPCIKDRVTRMTDSKPGVSAIRRLMDCPMDQLYSELGSGPRGLSVNEVEERLVEHGPNILPEAKKTPLARKAIAQVKNLFNVLLIVAAGLSFITGIGSNDASSIQMGFAILLVVVVSAVFSLFQEYRAEQAVEVLRQLVPVNVRAVREGKVVQTHAFEIVPGDVISLEEGDKVPADARLVSAFQFSVDNSILTGEAEPQTRSVESRSSDDTPIEAASNLVFAGTTVASGSGTAVVLATGSQTRFGQVVGIARSIEEPESPLQREINHTARLNFILAICIGVLFLFIALQFLHLTMAESLLFMIGVMVCVVPEGLQITLTLSLAISSLAMSKRNVVVKRLSSVETLGSTTVICTDKTGTITEGQMTVRKVWAGGVVYDVSGEGYEPEGAILIGEKETTLSGRDDLRALCEVAALDNRATLVPPLDRRKQRWTAVGDSTDAALLVLAAKAGIEPKKALEETPRVGFMPFDSNRKMMTSIHRKADGTVTAYSKGAGGAIIQRCTSAIWGNRIVPMTSELVANVQTEMDAMAREAYRVIALAIRPLPGAEMKYDSESVETNLTFVGLVGILDPPRRDVAQAVAKARNAGVKIVMMTGDHELTAKSIASKVGIITSVDHFVMSCEKLDEVSDEALSDILNAPELVFARVTPEQKLRIVRALQKKGEVVAVTGDGVNDAPALLEADIGIAMGITGTDVARESADMVLLDDNFASIVNGVEVGRSVFDNLGKFIVYVFSHNWAELITFIVFVLLQTPLPLAVVGVLTIDLVLEILPSIALTMEPPEPGIMDRPPRTKKSRLFGVKTLARSCYIGSVTGVVAVLWCFQVWSDAGWALGSSTVEDTGAYLRGMTVVLVGIMAGQLGNLFATRTNVRSAVSMNLARNKWLLPSLAAELAILLAIVYVPFLHPVFGTNGIDPALWVYLFTLAPAILVMEEVRKYVVRTVILPEPAVAVHAPIPVTFSREVRRARQKEAVRKPFVEVGPPVVLLGLSVQGIRDALPVAVGLAEQSGSRIVVVSESGLSDLQKAFLSSESMVPIESVHVDIGEKAKRLNAVARGVDRFAERVGAEMVVVSVNREAFSGRKKSANWIKELSGRRLVLVSGPQTTSTKPERPHRLLIPVLEEFHAEPFALAGALTASSNIPDVDVVAARFIEMPPTIPLYSTYRPESLVDMTKELSFLKVLGGLPILDRLTARVVLVRNTARDLMEFAEKRRVDLIVLSGSWSRGGMGFMSKRERVVAAKSTCRVAIMIPAETHPRPR